MKEYLELFPEAGKEMFKEFGFDMTMDTSHVEEDEMTSTIKLKK